MGKTKKTKAETTNRGFGYIQFKDAYGCQCSLQQSSLVAPHIWLGMERNHEGEIAVAGYFDGKPLSARMHLSRKQVETLLPLLKHFVKTGELPTSYAGDLNQRWDDGVVDEE